VDPIAADTPVRIGVSQQDGMSWFPVEMFQHRAHTDSACGSTGPCGNCQYLAERTDGVPSYLDRLVPACVRHYDDPQRVSPTSVAVGRKYAEDTWGDCVRLVSRRYDNANSLYYGRHIRLLAIRRVCQNSEMLHSYHKDTNPIEMTARSKLRITNRIAKCASIYCQK
jgi:hypothetical protein